MEGYPPPPTVPGASMSRNGPTGRKERGAVRNYGIYAVTRSAVIGQGIYMYVYYIYILFCFSSYFLNAGKIYNEC